MLSYIDPLLFPDECDVYEVASGRYVYSMFKNGSSTLRDSGFRRLDHSELSQLDTVEVYLRNPMDRYVSGVRSYLEDLDPGMDKSTVLNMIDQYLFLNRHFCLQFHWLVNLNRHTPANIHIKPLEQLRELTPLHRNRTNPDLELWQRFQANAKLQFYLELDHVLITSFMHSTVKLSDIVAHVEHTRPDVYQEVIARSRSICSVLD